jgi:hypothetical protein
MLFAFSSMDAHRTLLTTQDQNGCRVHRLEPSQANVPEAMQVLPVFTFRNAYLVEPIEPM